MLSLFYKRNIFWLLFILFILSLIPILLLSGYNFPCADDFSASDTAYWAWKNTGSLLEVLKAAWENVVYNYREWSGVFASVFWTSLQPGIFGEQYYGITTWITVILFIVSVVYFFHVILQKYLKADLYETGIISILFLFTIFQCMPSGLEGLYWHAGVVNYTWAFCFLLFFMSLILSLYPETKVGKKTGKMGLAVIMAVLVGGGNFITALQGVLWGGFVLGIFFYDKSMKKKKEAVAVLKRLSSIILPYVFLLVSFAASVAAPGNKVRMGTSAGFSPIKAVLLSFYYALEEPIESWLSWPIIILWLLAIPYMMKIIKRVDFSFTWFPFVFFLGFGLVAAGFTPSLYAQGGMEAGRLHNTVFFIWMTVAYLVTIYFLGWYFSVKKIREEENKQSKKKELVYVSALLIFFLFASVLACLADERTYIGMNAFSSITSGEARRYEMENEIRIELLLTSEKEEVVLPGFSVSPELLLFQEISSDPEEWLNTVMAKYYGKDSVWIE